MLETQVFVQDIKPGMAIKYENGIALVISVDVSRLQDGAGWVFFSMISPTGQFYGGWDAPLRVRTLAFVHP